MPSLKELLPPNPGQCDARRSGSYLAVIEKDLHLKRAQEDKQGEHSELTRGWGLHSACKGFGYHSFVIPDPNPRPRLGQGFNHVLNLTPLS